MPESEHTQENLAYIRTHVERLEQLVRFEIRANKRSTDAVVEQLTGRTGLAEAYLALEGDRPRTQDELAGALGKSQPTISRILRELYDASLVIKVPSPANRQVMAYTWSDLESLLGVSKLARRIVAGTLRVADANGDRAVGAALGGAPPTPGAPPRGIAPRRGDA